MKLRGCLPQPLAAHARLANVDRGRLVFLVDAPVWHARLRLLTDRLCEEARALGLDVSTVVVKTARGPLPGTASAQGRLSSSGSTTATGSGTADAPTPAFRLSAAAQEVLREAAALLDPAPQDASPESSDDGK